MKTAYQQLFIQQKFSHDHAQISAINALAELSINLVNQNQAPWFKNIFHNKHIIHGLYLHGRVGRGKTMLMDLFFQNLAITKKKRIHFHRFMEEVHQQLNTMKKQEAPLKIVARQWAKKIKVLCFDEFFVSDIGDAMLLSGLFSELFHLGVVLVATSNCQPEQLYRNGLQRERFLPTIDLINQHCQILSVDGAVDHRLSHYHKADIYQDYTYPINEYKTHLFRRLQQLSPMVDNLTSGTVLVNNRQISYLAKSDKQIIFSFNALCSGPRSQRDYITIADSYEVLLLEGVPQFAGEKINTVISGVEDGYQRNGKMLAQLRHLDDEARRFIALVDECYDRKVRLIINAQVDIINLYQGQQLSFEFARCQSRLIEMQAMQYTAN
jgi:cell division protein ZapE